VALLSDALLAAQQADLPQCDELCGAFWAAAALRSVGIDATQEAAAEAAGSVLAPPDAPSSLPPGERGRAPRSALPVAAADEPAGTSAHGVARAVEQLSGGRIVAVPATGDWTASRLLGLLGRLEDPIAVIANVDTGELWDPAVGDDDVERYLASGHDDGPDSPWRVGHFVAIGPSRGGGRLLVVADSYPSRAMYLQPVDRVVAALRREDSEHAPGGLLVVTDAPRAETVRVQIEAVGLEPVLWDNGSPQPG
jgi:hypothetical protein